MAYAQTGSDAVSIGHAACQYAPNMDSAVAIGYEAARNPGMNASYTASEAVIIGHLAGRDATSLNTSIAIGASTLQNAVNGAGAVAVGWSAGVYLSAAAGAVLIGVNAGAGTNGAGHTAANCVYIGQEAGKTLNRASTLAIETNYGSYSGANALIYGEFDNRKIVINGSLGTKPYTVATLPQSAAAAGAGARSFVTDANATTFASIVAGSGSNGVPVYSDGTNWRIG